MFSLLSSTKEDPACMSEALSLAISSSPTFGAPIPVNLLNGIGKPLDANHD